MAGVWIILLAEAVKDVPELCLRCSLDFAALELRKTQAKLTPINLVEQIIVRKYEILPPVRAGAPRLQFRA
jgi:hypothetical protein